ncbi:MAG: protein YgfX [Gammaproteobacteria bacterium]
MREIELKPSRLLGVLLAGMGALALAVLARVTLPEGLWPVLAGVILLIAGWGAWRSRPRERLRRLADGRLQVSDEAGDWHDVEVLGDSFVSPLLIVLRYRIGGRKARSLVLLPDSADAEALRRLRVSLRWRPRTRSDTGFPDAG